MHFSLPDRASLGKKFAAFWRKLAAAVTTAIFQTTVFLFSNVIDVIDVILGRSRSRGPQLTVFACVFDARDRCDIDVIDVIGTFGLDGTAVGMVRMTWVASEDTTHLAVPRFSSA